MGKKLNCQDDSTAAQKGQTNHILERLKILALNHFELYSKTPTNINMLKLSG